MDNNHSDNLQAGNPLRKRFRIVRFLLLGAAFSFLAGLLFVLLPAKVYVTPSHIVIKHVFETRIAMKDIVAVQERITVRGLLSGTSFYLLCTKAGGYNMEDKDFLVKEGAQIVKLLGFVKQDCNYLNIRRVWCRPSSDGAYCCRFFEKALDADSIVIYSWVWLLSWLLGSAFIIPFGYVCVHPDNWKHLHMFDYSRTSNREPSLKIVRTLTGFYCFIGVILIVLPPVLCVLIRFPR